MPVSLGVALAVFLFLRVIPGDPVDVMLGQSGSVTPDEIAAVRHELHLDEPLGTQLYLFFRDLAHGDLGDSYLQHRPVTTLLLQALPASVELAAFAMAFAIVVAVPLGVISAVRPGGWLDRLGMGGAYLGISMPPFWLGIVAILVFGVALGWLPSQGRISPGLVIPHRTGILTLDALLAGDWPGLWDALRHVALPAIALGAGMAAVVARVVRSSMLEVLHADYVELARAKGVREWRVVARHALRNALIPTVTVVGLQMGVLLGGNMVVEKVFSWPGLGRMVVNAIWARDYPLVQGAVMLYALTFVAVNLVVDVLYTYLNPRIEL